MTLDAPHGVRPEHALHARDDDVSRSVDLVCPCPIWNRHHEGAVRQRDGARAMHRRTNGEAPREVDLFGRQWCAREKRRQHGVRERRQRVHAIECIIAIHMDLVLASASPRRAELLKSAGFQFAVLSAAIDETARPAESPEDYVRRLAREKAQTTATKAPGATILAADTTVVVDDEMLGKPIDPRDARRMLRLLQGRRHRVYTGVALWRLGAVRDAVEATAVDFSPMTAEEIEWYVASGEPFGKAGAYAIQGLASRFVSRIEGSYTNVVGLPIALVHRLLSHE